MRFRTWSTLRVDQTDEGVQVEWLRWGRLDRRHARGARGCELPIRNTYAEVHQRQRLDAAAWRSEPRPLYGSSV